MTSYNESVPVNGGVSWRNDKSAPGQYITGATYLTADNTSVTRSKTSTDTGTFIPGVYRINPYSVAEESIEACSIEHWLKYFDGYWTYYAFQAGSYPGQIAYISRSTRCLPAFKVPSDMPSQALVRAYGKILEGSVSGGENLGELRETLNTLRHPFRNFSDFLCNYNHKNLGLLNKLYEFLKTGKWIGKGGVYIGAQAAKEAAGAWLEFRYGILPIMYTVQDIIELVNKKVTRFNANTIRSVRAKVTYDRQLLYEGPSGFANIIMKMKAQGVDKFTCYASVQYRQEFETSLSEDLGLSLRFAPEVAWELTKLSWIVDWWIGVGDWLASLRAKPGITILGNTVGTKMTRSLEFTATAKHPNGGNYSPSKGVGSYKKESYSRAVNTSLPTVPLVDVRFHSYFHTLDALALLLQKSLKLIMK